MELLNISMFNAICDINASSVSLGPDLQGRPLEAQRAKLEVQEEGGIKVQNVMEKSNKEVCALL